MKLNQLINELESTTNGIWKGKKFDDIGEFHRSVIEESNKIVKPLGLSTSDWIISLPYTTNVIKYNLDSTDDQRLKYRRAGKVNQITFTPVIEMDNDATLEDLLNAIKKRETITNIERLEMQEVQLQEELQRVREGLAELKQELLDLK